MIGSAWFARVRAVREESSADASQDEERDPRAEKVPRPFVRHVVARQPLDGTKHAVITIFPRGYPYVIRPATAARLRGDEIVVLESDDGAFCEELAVGRGVCHDDGAVVLWFPSPPDGARLRIQIRRTTDEGERSHYIAYDKPAVFAKRPRSDT
jgi:hypothetical protein